MASNHQAPFEILYKPPDGKIDVPEFVNYLKENIVIERGSDIFVKLAEIYDLLVDIKQKFSVKDQDFGQLNGILCEIRSKLDSISQTFEKMNGDISFIFNSIEAVKNGSDSEDEEDDTVSIAPGHEPNPEYWKNAPPTTESPLLPEAQTTAPDDRFESVIDIDSGGFFDKPVQAPPQPVLTEVRDGVSMLLCQYFQDRNQAMAWIMSQPVINERIRFYIDGILVPFIPI